MEKKALNIVKDYIMEHLDKSDDIYEEYIEVYTVWKCKALQNWKFLISSTILDGMYYEVTYNGNLGEWYLDAYKKFENRVIKDEPQTEPQTIPIKKTMTGSKGERVEYTEAEMVVRDEPKPRQTDCPWK